MSGPLPVARVPRPQMPAQYDPALLEAAFQAIERDLVRRFTREADLALEPGKRLVLAGEGGNTQYALGLDDDGGLTVTNYLTGTEGELIVDWAQVDGAAARDLQIAALESSVAGVPGIYATISALASVESTLEASIASLSSGVTAAFAATNANVSTNASAIAAVNGAAAFYNIEVAASGSDPALATFTAGAGGSEIGLISRILRLKNIVGSATVEVMRAVGGLVFFSNPISMDFAGRRLTLGPGFGVSGQEVIFWFGPVATAPSAQSRTNGYFAFGSNGVPYFGNAALGWGATAPEVAASNALLSATGVNRVRDTRFAGGVPSNYWQRTVYAPAALGQFRVYPTLLENAVSFEGTFTANAGPVALLSTPLGAIAVYPGEKLAIGFKGGFYGSGLIDAYFQCVDASGAGFSGDTIQLAPVTGGQGRWAPRSTFYTVPSQAVSGRLLFFLNATTAGSGFAYIADPYVISVPTNSTVQPVFVHGQDFDVLGMPSNLAAGQAAGASAAPFSYPAVGQISINAHTRFLPRRSVSLPSATITGLANSTRYYVFRDTLAGSYIATNNVATANGYITDTSGLVLYVGDYTTLSGGGGGGGGGGGWGGGGIEP